MHAAFLLALLIPAADGPEPGHAANATYRALIGDGLRLGEADVRLAPPLLRDDQTADQQRAALRSLAGSDAASDELTRDAVTAPFKSSVHDLNTKGETLVRAAELVFVIHADLAAIDPDDALGRGGDGEAVEAGNMRFASRRLTDAERQAAGLVAGDRSAHFVHLSGRLLDRIHVEATDEIVSTRTADSLVVATRTDPRFGTGAPLGNRWWPIRRRGAREESGEPRPYPGGVGYVKISRYKPVPGALLVEARFAFAEPRAWFDGAPTLRSKVTLVAQDQIRRLRRELVQQKKPGTANGR